jgi:hypothetical protein
MALKASYMIIAVVAISALIGVAYVLPLLAPAASACYRCWPGQSDEHRNDNSDRANLPKAVG